MDLLDPKTGIMRGLYHTDADEKVIGITVGELRAVEKALQRAVRLMALTLELSAANPAHVGSYRNRAVQLLEDNRIEPSPEDAFFHDQRVALADAQRKLFS